MYFPSVVSNSDFEFSPPDHTSTKKASCIQYNYHGEFIHDFLSVVCSFVPDRFEVSRSHGVKCPVGVADQERYKGKLADHYK
jgi:hypothetical protein